MTKSLDIESLNSKSGLHIIAPYLGKIRPSLGKYLIENYCVTGGSVWDPFCGSGTIPLEAWVNEQEVIATDLNYYAYVLTMAKLNPPRDTEECLKTLEKINEVLLEKNANYSSSSKEERITPEWVKVFFHPKTLIEIIRWSDYLKDKKMWFILASLLGILHHQRPGFLSYPSSHGAPYLRDKKFTEELYPEMYEYRNVYERLVKKVTRCMKNLPNLDYSIKRKVLFQDSTQKVKGISRINTIITSPPYMKALTYARDNRLRLWFLGIEEWKELDKKISPNKDKFVNLMNDSIINWSHYQKKGDFCILIVGDILVNKQKNETIADHLISIAEKNNYKLIERFNDPIPESKKIVKGNIGVKSEQICVFQKGGII